MRIIVILLLSIVALNALAAGYSFITDPTGSSLGISTDYLRASAPFQNYMIPGIVLFLIIGVLSAAVAILAVVKYQYYPLLTVVQGCILIGWIVIQLLMVISFHPLHLIIIAIGLILILLGFTINNRWLLF